MKKFHTILFLAINLSLYGSTYYISPDGKDINAGTISQPFFTLIKAWKVISAGDTVYLRGGTYEYTSSQILTGKNGKPSDPIVVCAYPGEIPVLTKSSTYKIPGWPNGLIRLTANYTYWKGIEITGYTQMTATIWSGFVVDKGGNNKFEQINSHHNGHGMLIQGSTNIEVINCDFHHNYDPIKSGAGSTYDDADGLELGYIGNGYTYLIKGCRFWNNSDDGLDLWLNGSMVTVENCWSWSNGYREDGVTAGGNGNGFKLGPLSDPLNEDKIMSHLRTVTNCLSFNNRATGFHQNATIAVKWIYNNSSFKNGLRSFDLGYNYPADIVKNNISLFDVKPPDLTAESVVDHNTFIFNGTPNPDFKVTTLDFLSIDPKGVDGPRKADGSLPDIEFMHLAQGSDLIDAGVDTGLPYSGNAPDIGAFEMITGEIHLNQLPVISISSPAKGNTYTTPATLEINVDAYDPDGTISKVELYNGTIKLDERTSPPYSFVLKDLTEGLYPLRVVATDNLKAVTTSPVMEIRIFPLNETQEFFYLYPNPNDGRFSIDFLTSPEVANYTVVVVNLTGKTVFSEDLLKDTYARQFDLSYLNPGTYILMIKNNLIFVTQKFIKV